VPPIGAKTVNAIDRYLRERRSDLPRVVDRRQGWDDTERHRAMLRRRATGTGIGHIHPHQFRHTFARQRVAAEGTEGEV
jgi:integrase